MMLPSREVRPLVILAGFLGAGKTTFLRTLVPALLRRGLRSRVILNDVENAAIDTATLSDLQAELAPLTGSCLCCESQEGTCSPLCADASAAATHDIVLLELNGTTETALVLENIAEAPGLAHLSSPLQITTVDAVKFGRRGWMNAIERAQVATSSHLRLSKVDLVDGPRVVQLRAEVAEAVPMARWTDADALAAELAEGAGSPAVAKARAGCDGEPSVPATPRTHAHALLSCQIDMPFAVDGPAFELFLRALPPHIVRAKGVVLLRNPAGAKRSFQLASGFAEISPCALQDPGELAPVAVFVGSGIDVAALRRELAAFAR